MTCNCMDLMNKELAEYNGRLTETFRFGSGQGVFPTIQVEKIKTRGKRPVLAVPTYCPFCGTKYEGKGGERQDSGQAEPYVIWSNEHKCWWGADSKGYRTKLEDAGRYSREDALGICTGARGGRQFNDNPSEVPLLLSDARAFWPDDREDWAIARRNFREDRERDMLRAYGVVLDDKEDAQNA